MKTFNRRRAAPKVAYPVAKWDRATGDRVDARPPLEPARVLALDPSASALGWAIVAGGGTYPKPVVESSGTWRPSKAKAVAPALWQLGEFVTRIAREGIMGAPLACHHAAVEVPEGGDRYRRDPRTGRMVKLGGLRQLVYAQSVGVCLEACRSACLTVYPVGVSAWNHGAKKEFTRDYVAGPALGVSGESVAALDLNRTDAIGVGLWWQHARSLVGCDELLKQLRAAKSAGG